MGKRVTPTRGRLRELAERIGTAERALDILERRRDVLLLEFQDSLDRYQYVQRSIDDTFADAQRTASLARAREGEIALRSAAAARTERATVERDWRNVMGVRIPTFDLAPIRRTPTTRGYGFVGSSATIDEVADAYETLLERVVRAAEVSVATHELLDELESTNRRVNGLEHVYLPDCHERHDAIARRLAEREREEIVRRKWIKDHILGENGAATTAESSRGPAPERSSVDVGESVADGEPPPLASTVALQGRRDGATAGGPDEDGSGAAKGDGVATPNGDGEAPDEDGTGAPNGDGSDAPDEKGGDERGIDADLPVED